MILLKMDPVAERLLEEACYEVISNEYIQHSSEGSQQQETNANCDENIERTWRGSVHNPARLSSYTPLENIKQIRPRSFVKSHCDRRIIYNARSNQQSNVTRSTNYPRRLSNNNRLSGKVARRRVSYQNSMLDNGIQRNVNKNPSMMRRNAVANSHVIDLKTQMATINKKDPKLSFKKTRSDTQIVASKPKEFSKQLSSPQILKSGRSPKLTISAPVIGSLTARHGLGIASIAGGSITEVSENVIPTKYPTKRSKQSKRISKQQSAPEMLNKSRRPSKIIISSPIAGSFTANHSVDGNNVTRSDTKPRNMSKAFSASEILNVPQKHHGPIKLTISSPIPGSFAVTAQSISHRIPEKVEESLFPTPSDGGSVSPGSSWLPFSQFLSARYSPPSRKKLDASKPVSVKRGFKTVEGENENSEWSLKGKCVWINMTGQQVKLSNVDLLSLSEIERIALQKVASQTLHNMDLGVSITIPKDESRLMNGKNSLLHLHFTTKASRTKAKKHDHVFAIPLVRVVENDQLLRLQTIEQDSTSTSYSNANDGTQDASDSDSLNPSSSGTSPKAGRRIPVSPSDQGAILKDCATSGSPGSDDVDSAFTPSPTTSSPRNATNTNVPVSRTMRRRHAINTGIDEDESQLLKSLSETSTKDKKRSDLIPSTMPQVPYVVQKCCAHIIKHGLDVTGIFRVPGSKKRVKQLREEFDRGVDVKVEDDYLAHDVAALLKEFFRDLPEALLTRELYQAFISTTKLNKADRLSALRCLVWLLPMPNRDTFQQLLSFLATVAEYSDDRTDANGNTICGNKMGIPNLSMIFGPNILHRNKKTSSSSNDAQYQVQSLERAEESTLVITVVEDMIRNHKDLFMVPKETHGEILHTLQETDPHALDVLLRRKAVNYSRIETPQSSSEHTSDGGSSDDEFTIASPPAVNSNNNNNNNKGEFLTFERYNQRSEANTPDSRKSDILETDSENTPVSASEHKNYEADVDATLEDEITFSHQTRSISFTEDEIQDILLGDVKTKKNLAEEQDTVNETCNIILENISENIRTSLTVTETVKTPTPLPRKKRPPQIANSKQNGTPEFDNQKLVLPNKIEQEKNQQGHLPDTTPKPQERRARSATEQERHSSNSQTHDTSHEKHSKNVTQSLDPRPKFEWRLPNPTAEQLQQSRRKGFCVQLAPSSPRQNSSNIPAKIKSTHAERRSHIIDEDSTSGIADCDISVSESKSVEDLIKESRLILDRIPSHKMHHWEIQPNNVQKYDRDHATVETPVKKRPSALNLRMNRTYGTESSKVLHAVRIPKRGSVERGPAIGSEFHHDARGRRFSKDDMFFTLQGQKQRHGKHLYINI
ncbi:uncharacterized protein LOC120332268 isoform X2 [Styela clava]